MTTLTVDGMACDGCESTVVEALTDVSGVESATANHEDGTVTIVGTTEIRTVVEAIEAAGYDVIDA